jgi:TldD protein
MLDVLGDLMDSASAAGAGYADARHVRSRAERIALRNGRVDEALRSDEEGIGVRVRIGGAWGFAAARGHGRRDAEAALARALALARAQPAAPDQPLAPEPPASGRHESACERDPFDVSLEDKLAVLAAADEALRAEPAVRVATAYFLGFRDETAFASTEGGAYEQLVTDCGGGIDATAVDERETQVRSYPATHGGSVRRAGYEHFDSLDLAAHAPRVAAEATALLTAPACPEERTTLVLDHEQVGLQVHESVGHATELDRVLGNEASYAGTSFVAAEDLGSLRYGSELMNVTADATVPGGLGTFAFDDEGVEARVVPLVSQGVLRGFLSSRESAARIGLERSAGCMRAEGFARQPIVRMTNVNLEPGDAGSFDELIADTGEGLLIETNRSWSIDNRRLNFQFEGEAAWEIRNGERGRLLRNPSYAGVTPEFWGSCDAVCSPEEWQLISLLDCGKGEPGQIMRVSHGTAPARFRDVEVGVA